MMNRYILNDAGEPVECHDLMEWARWFEANDDARRVAADERQAGNVSTVFLGLNHNFGNGAPLLYETMIFGGEHDGYQERASTRAEAVREHAKALALVDGRAY